MPTLVVSMAGREMQRYEITHTRTSIGRDRVNDLMLDNPSISRVHAVLEYSANGFFVQDMSTNGVLVNNQKVDRFPLRYGDIIDLGKFKLKLISVGSIPENRLVKVANRDAPEAHSIEETFHMPLEKLKKSAQPAPIPIEEDPLKRVKIISLIFIVLVIAGVLSGVFFGLL